MDGVRTQEASSPIFRCAYHVFLSFRGEDTRKTFTDHLYTGLLNAGFHTFRDDDELPRGEDIKSELQKAIRESRISVVVLSENYASSGWCLDELVKILERKRTVDHKVLPVFYHVDPSDVRKQTGSFADAFAKHQEKFDAETDERRNEGLERMKGWRLALTEIANFGGMVLPNQANGHESKFVHQIVQEIGHTLKRTVLGIALYPIGIESRLQKLNSWLQDGSMGVDVGVICGMGGIGKTTIAKVVYNINFDEFEGSSFLSNIREISEQNNGLVHLQRQLLSDIVKGRKDKVYNVDEGIIKIKDAVCCKRILLVLDDVDQVEHLRLLMGMPDWFCPGSKILVTTRNEHLFMAHDQVSEKFKITELDDDESLRLFCWHAFKQDHPTEGFLELSKSVIKNCGGLPLALKVLATSLCGRDVEVWKDALKKLEAIANQKIQRTLEVSYKSLPDDHDKDLFLQIARSFVGKDKDYAVKILEQNGYYAAVGIQNLIDRNLITVDHDNKIRMHQLVQDMGKEIARQDLSEELGKGSKMLHHGFVWLG